MGGVLAAAGRPWDGVDLWDDEYPVEAELTEVEVREMRADLDRARAADLARRRAEFDQEYPPESYPDLSLDDDLADHDLSELPPSAAEDIARYQYDREAWARDRDRRAGTERNEEAPVATPTPPRPPIGPEPYRPPQRRTGSISPDMAQFQLVVDEQVGARFEGSDMGQWIFESSGLDRLVIPYDVALPAGAIVLRDDREAEGYVIDENDHVFLVPHGEDVPFGAETVRRDESGTWVQMAGSALMYRFDADGRSLGRERHDGRDQQPAAVMLVDHVVDGDQMRTHIHVFDVATRRLIATSRSGRVDPATTVEASVAEAFAGLPADIVADRPPPPSTPLDFAPVESTDEATDRPDAAGTRRRPLVWAGSALGATALVVGVLVLTGGDGEDDAAAEADADDRAAVEQPASADVVGADPDTDLEARPEPEPATVDPALLRTFGAGADIAVVENSDLHPEGEATWSIAGTDGQSLPASVIVSYFGLLANLPATTLSALFNNSAFPCGAATPDYRVTCPLGASELIEGEYLVVGARHDGPVAVGARTFSYGLALDDDGDSSDNYQFVAPFDADFYRDTEYWYTLYVDEVGTRTMWADGVRDGVTGFPRRSSAAVIEFGDTIVWFVPRSEVSGPSPAFRTTAFHDDGEPATTPTPTTSGGDVTGTTVDEPLTPFELTPLLFDDVSGVPAEVEGTTARGVAAVDPDAAFDAALVDDWVSRFNGALATGDLDSVMDAMHPAMRVDECRASVESTIAQASTVGLANPPGPPTANGAVLIYPIDVSIDYPTGAVDWTAYLTPGPLGRLYLVLPTCE